MRCSRSLTKGTKLEAATPALPSPGPPTTNPERKSELATSPLPSRGPKKGRTCYATPALLHVPNAKRGDKIKNGYLTLAFLGAHKRAQLLRNL